ncbi:MAG TPA: alkaline phosphatase PhoX, partial [Thermosynechococcaceae cyanobacterium]
MSNLSRREFLGFFGTGVAATTLTPIANQLLGSAEAIAAESLSFTPVRVPHPLPVYRSQKSFLATGINQGKTLAPATTLQTMNLAKFHAQDDVVVPPEFERYVLVSWGDRVFPNPDDYFGYNNDYVGFVGIKDSLNDGYLWVNHEYISFPISLFAPQTSEDLVAGKFAATGSQVVPGFPTQKGRELLGEFLYNLGGSIVRISRQNQGDRFTVVKDAKNRRLHGLSGLKLNQQRSDAYKTVTDWGSKSHQQGDENYLMATGPAAIDVFPLSVDGLGNKIIGTAYNCSGGTTPWGTILSAEENFQGGSGAFVGVTEPVNPNGTQLIDPKGDKLDAQGYTKGTVGAEFGLVGEKYGWMVEIDPAQPDFRPRKHTTLGRFRHENIAIRAVAGQKLVAYLGDDRRGGHTWKFVSSDRITQPTDKRNSQLFEAGTLYVAQFQPNGTGRWIPLKLDTPTAPNRPSQLTANDSAKLRKGNTTLPQRPAGGFLTVTLDNEASVIPQYLGKFLKDFYPSQGAVLVDAFAAANLVGGTPTARPEDLEIHPRTQEVFIAYTDGEPGSDGYPDSRIFQISKPSAAIAAPQPAGAIYKITEDSADGSGLTFRWARFAKGGEAGAEGGAGFASVDNLAFDGAGNLWGVTDMSTGAHNGFDAGVAGTALTIDHRVSSTVSKAASKPSQTGQVSNLVAVFGNNWLFYIPMQGQNAGEVVPFAYGPPRCELTGPTFVGDTLLLSVQH